jgi:membrane protease YdiL (CAAX protease family)
MMASPPWPASLNAAQANVQALALVTLFYGWVYGLAALRGTTALAPGSSPLWSVLTVALVMLLVVAFFSVPDAGWRASLGLARAPLLPTALAAAVGVGAAYGANIAAVLVFALVQRGQLEAITREKAGWSGQLAAVPLGVSLLMAVLAGLWEEVVFRGFLLGRLRVALQGLGAVQRGALPWRDGAAVLLSALLFGGGHAYQGVFGVVQTAAVGLALGALTVIRKSLWPAILAHVAIDAFGFIALKVLKPALERVVHGQAPLG